MLRTKEYHVPRDEAIERFIDKSKTYRDERSISQKDEDDFYYKLIELGNSEWDLWTTDTYNEAIRTIRYIKGQGYKVKVINKGNRVLILYKNIRWKKGIRL